jgi:nucleoside-diphosphate-sugar epimerase
MSASLISREDVAKRRAGRPTRFFLTGGTGFLGSHLAVALLKKGHRVCLLARSLDQQSAEDRVQALLDWFGLPADRRGALRVIEGDITLPGLGVEPVLLREVLQHTDEIVHCASNTAFSEQKRVEVEAVNGKGLSQVLECARASSAYFFHHVSTAFVAGNTSGRCAEEPATPRGFYNAYEETKCHGERMVMAACRDRGLRLAIYRPSIVYGDSRTGRSLLFNALYFPVRTAVFIKDLYGKDISERGGRKAEEIGVRMEPDGTIRIPLRVEVVRDGGINLIPVDYFTDAFLSIMEGAPDGGIFHIVNDRLTRIEEVIDYASRLFRMTGIRACGPEAFATVPRNAIEVLFDHYVEPYVPYISDTRIFEATNSRPLLRQSGVACPEFDYEMFARCMLFAIEAGWRSPLPTTQCVT